MVRAFVTSLLIAGCTLTPDGGRAGGGPAEGEEEPVPGPPFVADGGRAPSRPPPPDPTLPPSCFDRGLLPPDCALAGQWRLLHGQPEGACPFGASRHDLVVVEGMGLLCLQATQDFQHVGPGPAGGCALVLTGRNEVRAASDPYTETWTSRLTFAGDTGTGETTVVVTGGSNCTRKFQTTIDRK